MSASILSMVAFFVVHFLPAAPWPAAGIGFAVEALFGRGGREEPPKDAGSILFTMWVMLAFAGLIFWVGHLLGPGEHSDPMRYGAFFAGGAIGMAARRFAWLKRTAGRSAT